MRHILLIVAGGIAAYKSLELVRLLRREGHQVTAVLTQAGARFVTPMALQALTENKVYDDLWSLTDESEMGHIQLSRAADLLVVAPATANMLARMAAGMADDLATTILLATDKPVLVAPAMNVRMWTHPATQANLATLVHRGIHTVGPDEGAMACNEFGAGRLAEPLAILAAIERLLAPPPQPLAGRHILVTSGPTHEPIDPVRYIANRSSGQQGQALAAALRDRGARVTLVQGPVALPNLPGIATVPVQTAEQMLAACQSALPADAVICAAAVADWRVAHPPTQKLKKSQDAPPPSLDLVPNPDILATLAAPGPSRPALVVGFAAETDDVVAHATTKRVRKQCDWILANDVRPETGIMGGAENQVTLITAMGAEPWPRLTKPAVAVRLADRIANHLTLSPPLETPKTVSHAPLDATGLLPE